MAKWFSRLFAAVVTGVLIYWLTQGIDPDRKAPPPAPPSAPAPSAPRGYVVVSDTGPIRSIDDIGAGATICGSKTTVEALRSSPALNRFNLRVVPGSELFPAYQQGLCKGVLFRERGHVNAIFPADLSGGRVIELF